MSRVTLTDVAVATVVTFGVGLGGYVIGLGHAPESAPIVRTEYVDHHVYVPRMVPVVEYVERVVEREVYVPTTVEVPVEVPVIVEVPVEVPVVERVEVPVPTLDLPPCEQEDSMNCYWDASIQGNGVGRSFIDINGQAYYKEQ